jgi:hypothetical protein
MQETYPIEGMIVPSYTDEMDREQKIKISYQNLQRSIRLKQRIIALMNAYFLGRLLSEIESTTERFVMKRKLTKHYQTMVDNTFDLFEFRPSQILQTKVISVQAI